jgi:hypothetical protein
MPPHKFKVIIIENSSSNDDDSGDAIAPNLILKYLGARFDTCSWMGCLLVIWCKMMMMTKT